MSTLKTAVVLCGAITFFLLTACGDSARPSGGELTANTSAHNRAVAIIDPVPEVAPPLLEWLPPSSITKDWVVDPRAKAGKLDVFQMQAGNIDGAFAAFTYAKNSQNPTAGLSKVSNHYFAEKNGAAWSEFVLDSPAGQVQRSAYKQLYHRQLEILFTAWVENDHIYLSHRDSAGISQFAMGAKVLPLVDYYLLESASGISLVWLTKNVDGFQLGTQPFDRTNGFGSIEQLALGDVAFSYLLLIGWQSGLSQVDGMVKSEGRLARPLTEINDGGVIHALWEREELNSGIAPGVYGSESKIPTVSISGRINGVTGHPLDPFGNRISKTYYDVYIPPVSYPLIIPTEMGWLGSYLGVTYTVTGYRSYAMEPNWVPFYVTAIEPNQ